MKPGDLMRIKNSPDQTLWIRELSGQNCILIRNMTPEDGAFSSTNFWHVLVGDRIVTLHKLDLESIDEAG